MLLLDWELTEEITLGRLYRLTRGMGLTQIPQGIFYQALMEPLGDVLERVTTWCAESGAGVVIIDSFGPAAGGDPNDHEKAISLMSAIRKLGATSLIIDHQSKPATGQSYVAKRAFGPAWKGHLARSSLQIELVSNMPGKSSIILRHRKSNFAPLVEPIPFHILYTPSDIRIELADEADAEFQDAEALPAWQRVERYLTWSGPTTLEELKEECAISSDGTLNNALSELRKRGRLSKESQRGPGGKRVYELLN